MMVLYSGISCPFSHRCRFVLFEKDMDFKIQDVDIFNKPEDLIQMNPYNEVPVLVERNLVLHESRIINEYLDERFPHPQLMPNDPFSRASTRLVLHRLDKELFEHVKVLEDPTRTIKEQNAARESITHALTILAPGFKEHEFLMSSQFSMLDIAIAPLLWRLSHYNIKLPNSAAPVLKYAERIFQRESFIKSLTAAEKAMRR